MTRYAVFSYNADEQQRLLDYIDANTPEEAEEIVCKDRADQILGVTAVLTAEDLQIIANDLLQEGTL